MKKIFYVEALDYKGKIKGILNEAGGEMVNDGEFQGRDMAKHNGIEVYRFGKLGTTMVYGGRRALVIAGTSENRISRTRSRLEGLSGVNLIIPGEGRNGHG